MNHTGEYWFDFGHLDSPHCLAKAKSVFGNFQVVISTILQNMSNFHLSFIH